MEVIVIQDIGSALKNRFYLLQRRGCMKPRLFYDSGEFTAFLQIVKGSSK